MDARQLIRTRWGSLQWVRPAADAPVVSNADELLSELGFDNPDQNTEPEPPRPVVSVLGPVEVDGYAVEGEHPWKYNKAGELAVFLALAERPKAREATMEALWPGEPVNRDRLARIVSDARRQAVGENWLVSSGDVLSVDVDLDWARFEALRGQGDPVSLSQALELVRGPVFETPLWGFEWAQDVATVVRAQVAGVGLQVAETELEGRGYLRALWAARKGLEGDPWSVRLLEVGGIAARGACDAGAIVAMDHRLLEIREGT